jgi:hypothetical protein
MNLLLKYKDKIVSFGLLPIIITLIGIHLFPTTAMLGTGLAISIAGLLYDVCHSGKIKEQRKTDDTSFL